MKIAVAGTGYVGLVTGVCLAEHGHTVTCVDVDEQKIAQMQRDISPIYEDGLSELMKKNHDRLQLIIEPPMRIKMSLSSVLAHRKKRMAAPISPMCMQSQDKLQRASHRTVLLW